MNISGTEAESAMVAKTCGCKEKRAVRYNFVDSYHNLSLDKKDLIVAELAACEKLLKYTIDPHDKKAIETEIGELRMAIDLMP